MPFKASFKVDGKEARVLRCSYSLIQDIDKTGRPSSEVHGGTIDLEVESTDSTFLLEWMTDSFTTKKGTVTFFKRDSDSKMKELEFEDAYMVSFSEFFISDGEIPMVQRFTLSAKKIKMGGGEFENPWPI